MEKEEKWYHPFDSSEEYLFTYWIEEMRNKGYIEDVVYHPEPIILCPKAERVVAKEYKRKVLGSRVKMDKFTVLNQIQLTPDFNITFTKKFFSKFGHLCEDVATVNWSTKKPVFILTDGVWVVDIKGNGSRFHDTKYFSAVQKMALAVDGTYVQKVVVSTCKSSFFCKTFTPKRYLKTDRSNAVRKIHYPKRNIGTWELDEDGKSFRG